jgi:hypothetical protein
MDYSADNFSRHVNTKFTVRSGSGEPIELELAEVAVRQNEVNEQAGMERFSTFFSGPQSSFLPQGTYTFEHPEMGELQIFLVPLGLDKRGYRYEAIFNRFVDR